MIVKSLKKISEGLYLVVIDEKEYEFNEDIIVENRLVEGKVIDEGILKQAIDANFLDRYFNQALNYAITYGKSSQAIIDYLLAKGLELHDAQKITNKLIMKGLISDEKVIKLLVDSLVRKANGKKMITAKLVERKFSKELINSTLETIDMNDYFQYLKDFALKGSLKYSKETPYIRLMKTKKLMLQRGYTMEEIGILDDLIK